MGQYPALNFEVTMVPVDYVSRAIVHLSGQKKSWGRAFHFFHPAPIEWRRLMAILGELGYSLEEVPYDQWWRELKHRIHKPAASNHKGFLSTLMLALTAPHFLLYRRPPLDATHTLEGLEGTDIACPSIDRRLVGAYTSYWQQSGYLAT